MKKLKSFLILFTLLLQTSLHANFTLSEIRPINSAPHVASVDLEQKDFASHLSEEGEISQFNEYLEAPQDFNYWQEFFRMMLILGIILGSVLILAWILKGYLNKRVKQINIQHQIKVLERRNLSQKSMIYLIEVEGQKMLIGDSASGGVQHLMTLSQEEHPPQESEAVKTRDLASKFSFSQILQRKLSPRGLSPFSSSKNIKTEYEIHEEN